MLRLLKLHYRHAEIYWWLDSSLAPLLENDPDLAGIVRFERRRWGHPQNWPEMLRSIQWMRAQHFDLVIDLQCLLRSGAFAWLSRGKFLIGLDEAREGARGFFRGLGAANVQIVPYMGLFFAAYEALKPALAASGLPLEWAGASDGAAGLIASVVSKTAVYPLDTVRKRLQVQGPSRSRYVHRNIPEYTTGVLGTAKAILMREGVRGMYRGLTVALLKAAPASAVTMWTFERVMAAMRFVEGLETV